MAPHQDVAQRRKSKRFKQWNKTTVVAKDGGQGMRGAAETQAFTFDLSLGGAQVHSAEMFPVGSRVRLRMVLARTQDSVNLEGEIKWVKRHPTDNVYQMGIEFSHDSPQAVMVLMREFFEGRPAPGKLRSEPTGVSRS